MKSTVILLLFVFWSIHFSFSQNPHDSKPFHCNTPIELAQESGHVRGFGNMGRAWPRQLIGYKLDPNLSDAEIRQTERAARTFESRTNICMRPVLGEKDFLEIFRSTKDYFWSNHIGFSQNRDNAVYINDNISLILHEMGHALGLFHEHQRPDRDQYVRINWDNVEAGFESNFRMLPRMPDYVVTDAYDYRSIMHYFATTFTNFPGRPTITRLDGTEETAVGGSFLTAQDLEALNRIYPQKLDCDSLAQERIPLAGFNIEQQHTYCTGSLIQLSNISKGKVNKLTWNLQGAEPFTSNEEHPVISYPRAGDYIIGLLVENEHGTNYISQNIKIVEGQNSFGTSIYPNPNRGFFSVNLESQADQQGTLQVFDLSGNLLVQEQFEVPAQCRRPFNFTIPRTLANGIYIYKLQMKGAVLRGKLQLLR